MGWCGDKDESREHIRMLLMEKKNKTKLVETVVSWMRTSSEMNEIWLCLLMVAFANMGGVKKW